MKRARRDPIVLGLLLVLAICAIPGVVDTRILLAVSAVVAVGIAWRCARLRDTT
jgi:hypothetical protein